MQLNDCVITKTNKIGIIRVLLETKAYVVGLNHADWYDIKDLKEWHGAW